MYLLVICIDRVLMLMLIAIENSVDMLIKTIFFNHLNQVKLGR